MDVSPREFGEVQTLVRMLCGLVLTDDKTYLVQSRLEPVVEARGHSTFREYLDHVQQADAVALRDELVEALITGETSFNRDSHLFDEFRRRILPSLAEEIRKRIEARYPVPLARLWSAGCSTGQEAYSLAMAVHDFVKSIPGSGMRVEQFPILATDVSNRSLAIARKGSYLERDLDRGLTPEQKRRYFHQDGDSWTVIDSLKRSIEFRRFNFLEPLAGLGPFEVILCRNVLIYFDTVTRQRLCDQFYQRLAPGGLLILGAAESLYGLNTPLVTESIGTTMVYRNPSPQVTQS